MPCRPQRPTARIGEPATSGTGQVEELAHGPSVRRGPTQRQS
jgi:hypothetical protein